MKKLLLLLLIAVVGAGIAFGANAAFFSTASEDRPLTEPRGLVGSIPASGVALSKASASPKAKATTKPASREGSSVTRLSTQPAAAPIPPPPAEDGSPRRPRTPSGYQGAPEPTAMVVQGIWDQQDDPEDPCDLEESERDQRRCENEADREEDEANDEDR